MIRGPAGPGFRASALAALADLFPRAGAVAFAAEAPRKPPGLSHSCARYAVGAGALAPAARGLGGAFLALDDFALSNAAGGVAAGYVAAHAALGYTRGDLAVFRRNLVAELAPLPRPSP